MKFLQLTKILSITTFLLCLTTHLLGQNKKNKPISVGFYNVENLFDTIDNPQIKDEEFTPNGDKLSLIHI